MLDLESEDNLGSILTRGNILVLEFFVFTIVKPLKPILALLPHFGNFEKPLLEQLYPIRQTAYLLT